MQNRVFNYKGGLISDGDITIDIDYKVRLLGYKKLISIGEWRDFVRVEVEFIKYNNAMSKKIFGDLFTIENLPYYFKNKIDREITDFLTIFDDDINVVIDNFIIPKEQETLTEGKMSRIAVREIVRDVIKKVKEKKKGFFYLPDNENEVYSFSNLPFEVSLELTLKLDRKMEGYKTTGFYSPEDDVIEMIIIFNPNNIEKHMYELVGEVNEVIAHELEHAYQEYYGEFDRDYEDEVEIEDPYEYYTQEHEIPAQYKGFRRLSRLRKEPLLMTAKNWFKTHKDIHGLSDEEIEKVIEKIMNYKP
jgi:hypothetical protein